MTDPPILLADAAEVIKILIFLFIVGASLIGKLLNAQAQARQQARRQQRPRPAPQPRPQPQPQAANRPPVQANLENEIAEFLQRARGGPQKARPAHEPRPVVAEVMQAELISPGSEFGAGVSSHVKDHLQTNTLRERDAHLAERVGHVDEQVEGHLHEVFDHDLGRIEKKATGKEADIAEGTDAMVWEPGIPGLTADQLKGNLVDMLRSPQEFRKVVLLSEILDRPKHQWDEI